MNKVSNAPLSDSDWIDKGKSDAWAGKLRQPPEHDPRAASMYDLGYCEGEIERPPVQPKVKEKE